jgi:hypothetical protein
MGALAVSLGACGGDAPPPPPPRGDDGDAAPPAAQAAAPAPDSASGATGPFAHSDEPEGTGELRLADGSRFRTTLYHQTVVGRLRATHKAPYYIMSGRACDGCDANIAIYIHSPSDGRMGVDREQPRFPYPGRETFYEDGTLQYEARMFFGDCAAELPNAVLWFQRRPDEAGRWRSSVLVARVEQDTLTVATLDAAAPSVAEAEAAVRGGSCRELPGVDRASEP